MSVCKFQTIQTKLRYRRVLWLRNEREAKEQINRLAASALIAFCVVGFLFVCMA